MLERKRETGADKFGLKDLLCVKSLTFCNSAGADKFGQLQCYAPRLRVCSEMPGHAEGGD